MKYVRNVSQSIVELKRQLRAAIKDLNQDAAKLLTAGKYEASSALVESAKRASEFVGEVEALRERWKSSMSAGRKKGEDRTPLWEYYGLVANALTALGGEGSRGQIIDWVSEFGLDSLKTGDFAKTSSGKLIWQRDIGRAKKSMIKEGYLDIESRANWKLTRLGHDLGNNLDSKSKK